MNKFQSLFNKIIHSNIHYVMMALFFVLLPVYFYFGYLYQQASMKRMERLIATVDQLQLFVKAAILYNNPEFKAFVFQSKEENVQLITDVIKFLELHKIAHPDEQAQIDYLIKQIKQNQKIKLQLIKKIEKELLTQEQLLKKCK